MATQFLSRREFAEEIGVSITTLYRGMKNDEWPFSAYIRIGNQLKYPIELVEELKRTALKDSKELVEPIQHKEKQPTVKHCKNCGKEIEKHRILCDECKKTFRKDSRRKYYYSHRYGIKENQPIVRHCKRCGKKIGKYKQLCDRCKEILNGKRPTVRYCKKCGKEVEKRRHFCDECLNIKMKEYTKAYTKAYYNRPEIKEKQKEYYKRPEINEKRKEYYREYSKRKRAEAKQKTKSCPK